VTADRPTLLPTLEELEAQAEIDALDAVPSPAVPRVSRPRRISRLRRPALDPPADPAVIGAPQ
jgi:hypothetical protein